MSEERLRTALADRYRIERELGRGGMATVYLAQDVKHDRRVALKLLKPELAAVVGAERFLAEIRTTANLGHPNILPLFDSGEADGFLYYVMPYVEGETLRDRLDREKQLPVPEAVRIAREVAEALDHAHRQGVVHRDVKPANVLLQDGRPVVADFGIALAVSEAGAGRLTETGLSVGTPHYMSPEQASGDREVDPRSDVYSLGCVLYEMLTGEPPWGGGSAQAVLARILTAELERPTDSRGTIPPHVESVVFRAMERVPADRFSTAAGFAEALRNPDFRHGPAAKDAGPSSARGWRTTAVAAGVAAILLGGALAWSLARRAPPPPTTRAIFATPPGQEIADLVWGEVALPADGGIVVYVGSDGRLWVKEPSSHTPRPLPGTEGAIGPEIDPSGARVAYYAGGALFQVAVSGDGAPTRLADDAGDPGGDVAWLDDGSVAFLDGRLSPARVPNEGGEVESLGPLVGDGFGLDLEALPGGRLLVASCDTVPCTGASQRVVLRGYDVSTGEAREITRGVLRAWWIDSGHLVMARREGDVFVAGFDPETMELGGTPTRVLTGVSVQQQLIPDMEVSRGGHALIRLGGSAGDFSLQWVDRDGGRTPVDARFRFAPGTYPSVRLSPDGRYVAFARTTAEGEDVWVKELDDGPEYRLTFADALDFRPEWSPSGDSIYFISERGSGNREVWARPFDGTGSARRVASHPGGISQAERTPDGARVIYRVGTAEGRDLLLAPWDDAETASPLLADPGFDEKAPALSPDGRWLAYESDEAGRDEVYVRPFPDVGAGRWKVSLEGGVQPSWSDAGDELFFVDGAGDLVVVRVDPGPPFVVSRPDVLFTTRDLGVSSDLDHTEYDVDPSGQRFLSQVSEGSEAATWVKIDDWGPELERAAEGGGS